MFPAGKKPAFLVTIDTEGDNLWSQPQKITTENALYLPRFQALCEKYELKPTYLTNYEMGLDPRFGELGQDALKRGVAEIGLHVHAWNTPPLFSLTGDDFRHRPYLVDYPEWVMRAKIKTTASVLEDTFQVRLVSHRAGRWKFNPLYARIVYEQGIRVDCSVTPRVNWSRFPGDPQSNGGADYRGFPTEAYFVDLEDISRPGGSDLLEVPVTIFFPYGRLERWLRLCAPGNTMWKVGNRVLYFQRWLRPRRGNLVHLLQVLDKAIETGSDYVEFMLHSSELMAGGSPTFSNTREIEELYEDMECLFATAAGVFNGLTLAEYYERFTRARRPDFPGWCGGPRSLQEHGREAASARV